MMLVQLITLTIALIGMVIMYLFSPKNQHGTFIYNSSEEEALRKKARKHNAFVRLGFFLTISSIMVELALVIFEKSP